MGDFILEYDFAESGFISGHIRLSNRMGSKQPNRMDTPENSYSKTSWLLRLQMK